VNYFILPFRFVAETFERIAMYATYETMTSTWLMMLKEQQYWSM